MDISLLYRWRRQFYGPQPRLPAFMPITVAAEEPPPSDDAPEPAPAAVPPPEVVEIEFATARLRFIGAVDPVVIAVIAVLTGQPA